MTNRGENGKTDTGAALSTNFNSDSALDSRSALSTDFGSCPDFDPSAPEPLTESKPQILPDFLPLSNRLDSFILDSSALKPFWNADHWPDQ
jgi:hypothetical protein